MIEQMKFPDDFVQELAAIDDNAVSALADKWMPIEPSFEKCN
jgi:hypothetical protein